MYPTPQPHVERARITKGRLRSTAAHGNNGAFEFRGPNHAKLFVIASDQGGWQHVSVSVIKQPKRCPTWEEMCFVKDLFWQEDEVVVQYHPAKKDNVSFADYTLHLWRPVDGQFVTPPHIYVGPKTVEEGLETLKEYWR